MAGNPYLWSTTAATNASADSDINWAEGQLPGTVNDSARGVMAGVAGWLLDTNSTLTTGGSANAQTVTTNVGYVALATGIRLHLKAGFTNTSAMTLNVTPAGGGAFGAKAVKIIVDTGEIDPVANNVRASGHYVVEYDAAANAAAGAWILLNPSPNTTAPGFVFISTQTAAASATVDFTTGIDGTYEKYIFEFSRVISATNLVSMNIRVSEDAGANWKSGASDYTWTSNVTTSAPTNALNGSLADTALTVAYSGVSNTAPHSLSGTLALFGPSSTTLHKIVQWDVAHKNSAFTFLRGEGGGSYIGTTNAINGVRFLMSSGNITSGTFTLYGVRKT